MGNMCCSRTNVNSSMLKVVQIDYGIINVTDTQGRTLEVDDNIQQKNNQGNKKIIQQILAFHQDFDDINNDKIIDFVNEHNFTIRGHLENSQINNIRIIPENFNHKTQSVQKMNTQQIQSKHSKSESNKYIYGTFTDGKAQGLALYYCTGLYYYIGNFIEGEACGHGILVYANSKKNAKNYHKNLLDDEIWCGEYQGDFIEGKAHGLGKYTKKYQNNDKLMNIKREQIFFEGQWLVGVPVSGSATFGNNSQIICIQIIDSKTRQGIIYMRNGGKYKGHFNCKLQPSGIGNYTSPPQDVNGKMVSDQYDGQWLGGKYHGQGRFSWKNGSSYEGFYSFGKKQGQGKYTFSSKSYYIGEWLQGKQNGRGILYNQQGQILKRGLWSNGFFIIQIPQNEWDKKSSNK